MIESIYVKDFALIDELEVTPGAGLNIITGQTGAGKSILIGALNMIRASVPIQTPSGTGAQKGGCRGADSCGR